MELLSDRLSRKAREITSERAQSSVMIRAKSTLEPEYIPPAIGSFRMPVYTYQSACLMMTESLL